MLVRAPIIQKFYAGVEGAKGNIRISCGEFHILCADRKKLREFFRLAQNDEGVAQQFFGVDVEGGVRSDLLMQYSMIY